MNIFVTGLTSSAWGGMEFHNLGNYIIAEPLFKELRKTFPNARISTGMQMSNDFYQRHNLVPLENSRFWSYGAKTGLQTAVDIVRLALWKVTRVPWLLKSEMLSEISQADLVIDFSGDIYGDNASWRMYLEGNARLMFAILLKKKTAMIIGSPGPFASCWRRWLAKRVLLRLDLITNREPMATAVLANVGIKGENIYSTACPSVLFQGETIDAMPRNQDYKRLFEDRRPTIGFILCGWNMPAGPFNKWPREDWEFEPFISLIQHLKSSTEYRVCLMSHQNATDDEGNLVKGNDHRIIDRLIALLGKDFDGDKVFMLSGLYGAAQSKTVISSFDLLISGRIHGAVQGLSQGIPTAIIDYGHEPKAHKLRGFARIYGIDDLVLEPREAARLIDGAEFLIANASSLRLDISKRVSHVKKLARMNFDLLASFKTAEYA